MTREELRVQLDINDSVEVLKSVGKLYSDDKWFVICDDGICHLFKDDGTECDIREVKDINEEFISKSIKKIIIPSSVTSIGDWAFCGCHGLTSVTIGNGVTSIKKYAFFCCSGLMNVTVPDRVTSIGEYAFVGCSGLKSVMIGNGVTSIGGEAFSSRSSLKSIIFEGKTLKEVKQMAYYPWGITDTSVIKCKS